MDGDGGKGSFPLSDSFLLAPGCIGRRGAWLLHCLGVWELRIVHYKWTIEMECMTMARVHMNTETRTDALPNFLGSQAGFFYLRYVAMSNNLLIR